MVFGAIRPRPPNIGGNEEIMTTQRQVAIKKSANQTKHQRAMANPKVQELVSNLARDWAAIDHLERDARLRELAAHGCSARGLGKVLGHSASYRVQARSMRRCWERRSGR